MAFSAEARTMPSDPAVRCCDCGFAWNSAAMAEGLRLLGSCPKCGGELLFANDSPVQQRNSKADERFSAAPTAPHLVLGIPRR